MISTIVAAAAEQRRVKNLPEWQLKILTTANFISGDALAAAIGITAGTSRYSNTDWLEIVNNVTGVDRIIPKMPLRYNMAVSQVLPITPADGSKTIEIKGRRFSVQMMTTAEWTELMYAVCANRPVGYTGLKLAEFTPAQLGHGTDSLGVRGMTRSTSGSNYINRGGNSDVINSGTQAYGLVHPQFAWRPILTRIRS